MMNFYDLKPGIKFMLDNKVCYIVNICKSRDKYSVDISYKYYENGLSKYNTIVVDKDEINEQLKFED